MYSIGEFSKITLLTVKTLRFYHEKELLVPSFIRGQSGQRFYNARDLEKARVIVQLRNYQFSLKEIQDILDQYDDEGEILNYLEQQKKKIESQLVEFKTISKQLEDIIMKEKNAKQVMQKAVFEIEVKTVEPQLIAGVRMKGKYSECGKGFALIGKKLGRFVNGKAFCLYYDSEYKEDDADFETCMPIKRKKEVEGISIRELEGAECVTILHKGPYTELALAYEKVFAYVNEQGWELISPLREVYHKGPGMIFKGNPKNYLTELQFPVKRV